MFHLLDASLEAFIRERVPLAPTDVDIVFDAPTSEWAARLSRRPTVDLFLWDARISLGERVAGLERGRHVDGSHQWEMPVPRVALRYLVTAWTSDPRDEHSLVGAVMQLLSTSPVVPEEFVISTLGDAAPLPGLQVGTTGAQDMADLWSALGGRLKLALDLQVTTSLLRGQFWPAGPVVRRVDLVAASKEVEDSPLTESRVLHDARPATADSSSEDQPAKG